MLVLACANLAFLPESPARNPSQVANIPSRHPSLITETITAANPTTPIVLPQYAPISSETGFSLDAEKPDTVENAAPTTEYVVIISVDGLRPDALFLAHTPNLDKLIEKGVYCPHAQTLSLSLTLPSHASMLSGMLPEKHGALWGLPYIGWPGMKGPTVFNVAHDAGLKTGMVFGKNKLSYIAIEDSVDELYSADVHDPEVKEQAIEVIEEGLPNVLFIHFPDTDRVGHAFGWMSENQLYSVNFVDGLIGEIVDTLEREGYLDKTMLIVTSDHGGHGFGHGDDAAEDRTIPWLAVGPEINAEAKITRQINTYDTAATAAYALNLPIPEYWDGQPVTEIFAQSKLPVPEQEQLLTHTLDSQ